MELIRQEKLNGTNPKPEKKKTNWKHELWENVKTIGLTVVITLLILHFVAQLAVVKGESMANTLHDSNIVLLEKLTQRFSEFDRYDVVVFNTDNPAKPHYIKRVIGLPGETVQINAKGEIFINDEKITEYYGLDITREPGMAIEPITLGEDEYFCMGDNRNNSVDSRFEQIGPVSKDIILGRVLFGLMPLKNPNTAQSAPK